MHCIEVDPTIAVTPRVMFLHTAMLRFLLIISFATLLLIAGVASAFEPGAHRGAAAGPFRAAAQTPAQRRDGQREALRRQAPAPTATPGPRQAGGPHPPDEDSAAHENGRGELRPVSPQRGGRLSPDERRALRQQIDEAGRDVYRPQGANRP
jgi:hypothetical protein